MAETRPARIEQHPDGKVVTWLVVLYGLYQAGHAAFNATYLMNPITPPLPAPTAGWHPQTVDFLTAMAGADLVGALASMLFVYGYLRHTRWSYPLGIVCVTISMYAATVFTWGSLAAGAWSGNLGAYLAIYLPFTPALALALLIATGRVPRGTRD